MSTSPAAATFNISTLKVCHVLRGLLVHTIHRTTALSKVRVVFDSEILFI